MGKLPYENYIFDLYGTLVDIHTEEDRPEAWAALARFYSYYGADYAPRELQQAFRRMTAERTAGREAPRRESHEACPEIEIEEVFLALFRQKGAAAGRELAVHAGQFFRAMTTDRLRLYDGVPALLRTPLGAVAAPVLLVAVAEGLPLLGKLASAVAAGGDWSLLPFVLYPLVGCPATIPLLYAYRGRRGLPMKWFFYAYYPAHIAVLGMVHLLVFG